MFLATQLSNHTGRHVIQGLRAGINRKFGSRNKMPGSAKDKRLVQTSHGAIPLSVMGTAARTRKSQIPPGPTADNIS